MKTTPYIEAKNKCKVIYSDTKKIQCETTALTLDIPQDKVDTAPGLRYRIRRDNAKVGFNILKPDDLIYDTTTTIMELSGDYNNNIPVYYYADGKFCPFYDGYYRFWAFSDDHLALSFKNPITGAYDYAINFQGFTQYNDYFGNPSTRSSFIFMKKDVCIEMKLAQYNALGPGYYKVGMEICEKVITDDKIPTADTQTADIAICSDHTKPSVNQAKLTRRRLDAQQTVSSIPIPNKSTQVIKLRALVKRIFRLTYSIAIPVNKKFQLTCGDTTEVFANSNTTSSANIRSFFSKVINWNSIVKRKALDINNLPVNEVNESPIAPAGLDLSRYFINLPVAGVVPLSSFFSDKTGGSNTAANFNFIYVIDRTESNVVTVNSVISKCSCKYLDSASTSTDFTSASDCTLTKIQDVSPKISGNMSFKISYLNESGVNENTEVGPIDINNSNVQSIESLLNVIPAITDKVTVSDTSIKNEDEKNYHIMLNTDRNFVFTDISGIDLNNGDSFIQFDDVIKFNKNFFFTSVPTEFLKMPINTYSEPATLTILKPLGQIMVYSTDIFGNEIQASCDFGVCDYKPFDKSYLPTITMAGYMQPVFGALIDKVVEFLVCESSKENCIFKIGYASCFLNVNPTNSNQLFCSSMNNIVAGVYNPEIITKYGYMNSVNTNKQTFPLSISSFSPNTISEIGGTEITIIGNNFPSSDVVPSSDISSDFVTVGGLPCIPSSISFTKIVCKTMKKLTNGSTTKVIVSFNTQVSISTTDLIWISQTESIFITDPSTLAYSPGDKKLIRVTFSSVDANGQSVVNFDHFDLTQSIAYLSHTSQLGYTVQLGIVTNSVVSTLDLAFPGGINGDYLLLIKLVRIKDKLGNAISKVNLDVEVKKFEISLPIIEQVSPQEGSPQGGTLITIKGKFFMAQLLDQNVYINKKQCSIQTASSNEITCITKGLTSGELNLMDKPLPLSVDQFIQYSSICANTCTFTYKQQLFTKISHVLTSSEPITSLRRLKLSDTFQIRGYGLDSLLTTGSTYKFYDSSISNLKDNKSYTLEEKTNQALALKQCKLTGSKCNFTLGALQSGHIADYKVISVTSTTAVIQITQIIKFGNFKFYLQTERGLSIFNYYDLSMNLNMIYSDSNVIFNFYFDPLKPVINSIFPTQISQHGSLMTVIASDTNQIPKTKDTATKFNILGNNCIIIENAELSASAKYQCLVIPDQSTYANGKSQALSINIYEKDFNYFLLQND